MLGLSEKSDGSGPIEALAAFQTNPAGAAIVDTIGPIRQIVAGGRSTAPRYMVVAPRGADDLGAAVQVQDTPN